MRVSDDEMVELCEETQLDIPKIQAALRKRHPSYDARASRIESRIATLRKRGLLPLDSGNFVSYGETLKGSSTLFGPDGSIKQQWVKTDVPKQQFLEHFNEAISEIVEEGIKPAPLLPPISHETDEQLLTVYISNDLHMGAYMWHQEVEQDWDINIASNAIKRAYDHLVGLSVPSKYGLVVDLGDLTETDDYKNMTPQSGHILDVDGRYPKVLRAAYESLLYGVEKALEKHEIVYFYNIAGNHDPSSSLATREVVRMYYRDNPRVIVCDSPRAIKYHQHGKTLLQFAHGDGMKMLAAGEVMAHDCVDIFSSTQYRYSHMGHIHVDSSRETRLCKVEAHRNLTPLNAWAYHKGFRGQLGTMKSIVYSSETGELTRQIFNVNM